MSAHGPWGRPTPAPAPAFADLYDGAGALARRVALRADGGALVLAPPAGAPERWPAASLRRLPDRPGDGALVLGLVEEAGPRGGARRLVVRDPDARAVLRRAGIAPAPMPGRALWRRAALVWAAALALLALLFTAALPTLAGLLAARMDAEAEVALGDAVYEQARAAFSDGPPWRECRDPEGQAALDRLLALVAGDLALPVPPRVAVLDDRGELVNAFALPGGRIVFTASMIRDSAAPAEVAAVMAHELGHVVHRDPVRGLLQGASAAAILSVLAGDVSGGGVLGGVAAGALTAGYSRGAEVRADAFAIDRLAALGLGGEGLAAVFARLREAHGEAGGLLSAFSTHPRLSARIAAAEAAEGRGGASLLSDAEWAALRAVCD